MGKPSLTTTNVEIFGAVYSVRGEHASDYLQELAQAVDERMREIARHVTTADPEKIAVLASLNMADELFQCRKGREGEQNEITEKAAQLAGTLREALGG